MPYILTTRRPDKRPSRVGFADDTRIIGRQAVATLDEAREAARDALPATANLSRQFQCEDLPESGGTVGPLPDGTVIEVTKAHGQEMVDALPENVRRDLWARHPGVIPMGEILTAFNSR